MCVYIDLLSMSFQEWTVFTDSYAVDYNTAVRAEVVAKLVRVSRTHPA